MCERVIKSMSLPRNNGMRCIVDDADDAPNENLDEKKMKKQAEKLIIIQISVRVPFWRWFRTSR